jgi:hypothetical protein
VENRRAKWIGVLVGIAALAGLFFLAFGSRATSALHDTADDSPSQRRLQSLSGTVNRDAISEDPIAPTEERGVSMMQSAPPTETVAEHVAHDEERKYEMVLAAGSNVDKCVYSGLVAAAWLQAGNVEKYRWWNGVKGLDCADADSSPRRDNRRFVMPDGRWCLNEECPKD